MEKTHYRLGAVAIAVLVFCAIVADAVTLIPLAGDFIGPIYWILVSIFLYLKGFGILNARRLATSVISMAAEMIPAIQELPLILAGTIAVIIFSRIEDKAGIKLGANSGKQLNQGGIRQPQPSQRAPLNKDGVRTPSE